MLEPFRIRDLGNSSPEPPQDDSDSSTCRLNLVYMPRREGSHMASLAQVTAAQYDETISKNPRAKLSYMDDEDGELITVGSSAELAQRLAEPVAQSNSRLVPRSEPRDSVPRHIFDIRRSKSVLEIWREIHRNTVVDADMYDASPPPSVIDLSNYNPKASVEHQEDAPPVMNNGKGKDRVKSDDEVRESWVRACDPPRPLSTLADSLNKMRYNDNTRFLDDDDDEVLHVLLGPNPHPDVEPRSAAHLTEEGQRQAQEAGAKLRNARSFNINDRTSSPLIPAFATNPWSSYSNIGASSSTNRLTEKEPASNESPVEENNRPLFSNFESELSRMMKESLLAEPTSDNNKGKEVEATPTAAGITEDAVPEPSNSAGDSEGTEPATAPAEPQSLGPESSRQSTSTPPDVLGTTINAIFSGVNRLASELRSRLPEFEQRLSDLHQQLPSQVESAVQRTVNSVGAQIHVLANAMQEAAVSARQAADNRRDTEIQAAEQLIGVLRDLAGDFGDMGRTLFAAFEAQSAAAGTTQQQETGRNQAENDQGGSGETMPKNTASGTDDSTAKYDGPFIVHSSNARPQDPVVSASKPSADSTAAKEQPANADADNQASKEVQTDALQIPDYPAGESPKLKGKWHALFVTNLHADVTETDIAYALTRNGFLGEVKLPKNAFSTGHKGFCYVLFPSVHAAKGARELLQGMPIHGQPIHADLSQSLATPSHQLAAGHKEQASSNYQTLGAVPPAVERQPASSIKDKLRHHYSLYNDSKPFNALYDIYPGVRRAKSVSTLRQSQAAERIPHSSRGGRKIRESANDSGFGFAERNGQRLRDLTNEQRVMLSESLEQLRPFSSPKPSARQYPTGGKDGWENDHSGLPHEHPDDSTPSFMPNINTNSQIGQRQSLPNLVPTEQLSDRPRMISRDTLHRANTTTVAGPSIRRPAPPVPPPRRHQHYSGLLTRSHTERHHPSHHSRRDRGPQHPGELFPNTPGSFPIEYPRIASPRSTPSFPAQPRAAQGGFSNEIEKCTKHLEMLGFGNAMGGDSRRLRVYAEAARGNLEDAIEMIEEERKAYEQQPPKI